MFVIVDACRNFQKKNKSCNGATIIMRVLLAACYCCASASALAPSLLAFRRAMGSSPRAACAPRLQLPFIPPDFDQNDDGDELDALEGGDSWEQQLAEQKAWEERMALEKAGNTAPPPEEDAPVAPAPVAPASDDSMVFVDESAWFDDEADVEAEADRVARQKMEKAAAETLSRAQTAAPLPNEKRLMTSLEAVLNTMVRLETKLDKLTKKVDALSGKMAPSPPAADVPPADPDAPPAPPTLGAWAVEGWDGEVDEDAWFDEDADEDLPDWRDVRKAKGLDKPAAAAPPTPPKPTSGDGWDGEVNENAFRDDSIADEVDLADWRDVRRLKGLLELEVDTPEERKPDEEGDDDNKE